MPNSMTVTGLDGLRGHLIDPIPRRAGDAPVRVQVEDGPIVEVPASRFRRASDGSLEMQVGRAEIERARETSSESAVIPLLAEELIVNKEAVPTGGVRVRRRVYEHDEIVETPLLRERVDVRRVVLDEPVDGPLPVRREGDTTIIPIVEEVLVVQKQFRLKEEIHVTRTLVEERYRERVTLHRQEPEIEPLG